MTRRTWALLCAAPPAFYLTASLVLFIGLMVWGGPAYTNQQQVATVLAGSPAEAAGIRIGDVLMSIDGERTDLDHPPAHIINRGQGRPVRVAIERGATSEEIVVAPRRLDQGSWSIGVQLMPSSICKPWPIARAATESLIDPVRRVVGVVLLVKAAFQRRADVFGPVAMARQMAEPACSIKLRRLLWIETPFALCCPLSLLVLFGFVINSARRSRSSARSPQ